MLLVLSFSALMVAQPQTTGTAEKKQEAVKAEQKAKVAAAEHIRLTKSEIMALQDSLAKAGFYKGKANGILNTGTKKALREYQKANNLKVTGTPTEETLAKLHISYGAAMTAKAPAPPTEKMEKKPESAKKP